jgi:hypothetical protein
MSNHNIGDTLYEQANGRVTKWDVIAVAVDPKYFNPYNERVLVITMRSEGIRGPSYCAVTKDALDAELRRRAWHCERQSTATSRTSFSDTQRERLLHSAPNQSDRPTNRSP